MTNETKKPTYIVLPDYGQDTRDATPEEVETCRAMWRERVPFYQRTDERCANVEDAIAGFAKTLLYFYYRDCAREMDRHGFNAYAEAIGRLTIAQDAICTIADNSCDGHNFGIEARIFGAIRSDAQLAEDGQSDAPPWHAAFAAIVADVMLTITESGRDKMDASDLDRLVGATLLYIGAHHLDRDERVAVKEAAE